MIVVLFRNDIRICKVFGNEIDEYLESFFYPEAKKDKSYLVLLDTKLIQMKVLSLHICIISEKNYANQICKVGLGKILAIFCTNIPESMRENR